MAGSSSGSQLFYRVLQEPMDSNNRPAPSPPASTPEPPPYKTPKLDVKSNVAQVKSSPKGKG